MIAMTNCVLHIRLLGNHLKESSGSQKIRRFSNTFGEFMENIELSNKKNVLSGILIIVSNLFFPQGPYY